MQNQPACKLLTLFFAIALLTSCAGKNDLIVGEWHLDSHFVNGQGQDQSTSIKWTFNEDGLFTQLIENPLGQEGLKGTWTIDEEAGSLTMFYTTTQITVLWQITNLNRDMLEVNHTAPGFFVERAFKKIR